LQPFDGGRKRIRPIVVRFQRNRLILTTGLPTDIPSNLTEKQRVERAPRRSLNQTKSRYLRRKEAMPKSHTKVLFAEVKGFDPNRPDLQEFLNKLAAELLGDGAVPIAPRKRSRKKKRPLRSRSRRS
jgi:hypothetical protein